MVTLRFVYPDGSERVVQAPEGISVMKAAVSAGIVGVAGDCGGNLSCATCHCYIGEERRRKLPAPPPEELAMLDCALDVTDDSRLTCQIQVSSLIDGITIHVPEVKI